MDLSGPKPPNHTDGESERQTLTFDGNGPWSVPLSTPDDSEALHNACKCTRGCFFDEALLQSATNVLAGVVPRGSVFFPDKYFERKKRKLRPNALQWYTIFSLSPCCELVNAYGRIPPPEYIRRRHERHKAEMKLTEPINLRKYDLSPVRVKSLLIMRIMDYYRFEKYGVGNKLLIHFTLPLEFETRLHYELTFTPGRCGMVGNAHIELSISGDAEKISLIKRKYEKNAGQKGHRKEILEKSINKIASFLEWVEKEDSLESKITPIKWDGHFMDGSDFLLCISKLDRNVLYRHFRCDAFEVISTCSIKVLEDQPISAIIKEDSGRHQLLNEIERWSTKTIQCHNSLDSNLFIKELPNKGGLTYYCLIEVVKTDVARIYSVQLHFFEQVDTQERLDMKQALKAIIKRQTNLQVAPRPISKLVTCRSWASIRDKSKSLTSRHAEAMHLNEKWELPKDPDLLHLLIRRRTLSGDFWFLDGDETHAVFGKFVKEDGLKYLVQYRIQIKSLGVQVDIFMDYKRGEICAAPDRFFKIHETVMKRDKECGEALQSRRNLLNLFDSSSQGHHSVKGDTECLLSYSTIKSSRRLRFFLLSSGEENNLLEKIVTSGVPFLVESRDIEVKELDSLRQESIAGMTLGTWFCLSRYGSNSLGFLHLPAMELEQFDEYNTSSFCYREVTFFTIHINDLYHTRDENDGDNEDEEFEDDDDDDKISLPNDLECQGFIAFEDSLVAAHQQQYSFAAYLALCLGPKEVASCFMPSDFQNVLAPCTEKMIMIDVEIDFSSDSAQSKLNHLINEMLHPVAGESNYYFFHGDEVYSKGYIGRLGSQGSFVLDIERGTQTGQRHSTSGINIKEAKGKDIIDRNKSTMKLLPPLFVSFTLNGIPWRLDAPVEMKSTASLLCAFITVFKDDSDTIPEIHQHVARKLNDLLESFVAEQKLDFFYFEEAYLNQNVDTIKKCLCIAQSPKNCQIQIQFDFQNPNSNVSSSSLLCEQLLNQTRIPVTKVDDYECFVTDVKVKGWCYMHLKPQNDSDRVVQITVYHPEGNAEEIANELSGLVQETCHLVNQIFLLKELKRTKKVSNLLIPMPTESPQTSICDHGPRCATSHAIYECSLRFMKEFEVEQCSASEAIGALTSMHFFNNIKISNITKPFFVYLDERQDEHMDEYSDRIFYMTFETSHNGINFLVYGLQCHDVSEGISEDLVRIIQEKIVEISIKKICNWAKDLDSKVKNDDPQITFLRSFASNPNYQSETPDGSAEEIYMLPSAVYDPIMVFFFFMQNIIGSTYFKVLSYDLNEEKYSNSNDSEGLFWFDNREFSLLYNTYFPYSDLPYQKENTITEAGKEFFKLAGKGVAIIELTLLDSAKRPVEKARFVPEGDQTFLVPIESLRLEKDVDGGPKHSTSNYLSVRIINTTLKLDGLHRWIELTFNQALVAWATEKHIRSVRLGKFKSNILRSGNSNKLAFKLQELFCGLPELTSCCLSLNSLPHPAIGMFEEVGPFKASRLCQLTRDVLESLTNQRQRIIEKKGIKTLRICNENKHAFFDIFNDQRAVDRPTDSPQYIAVYGLCGDTEKHNDKETMLFREVSYLSDDEESSFSSLLRVRQLIRNKDPYRHNFMRRLVLIVIVSKTSLTVLTYNLYNKGKDM